MSTFTDVSEVVSAKIVKKNVSIESISELSRAWLKKISGKIEEYGPKKIIALHETRIQYTFGVFIRNIDPKYWRKQILIEYHPVQEDVNINIKLYNFDEKHNIMLKKWWVYWINDYTNFIQADSLQSSFEVVNKSNEMRRELIKVNVFWIANIILCISISCFVFFNILSTYSHPMSYVIGIYFSYLTLYFSYTILILLFTLK